MKATILIFSIFILVICSHSQANNELPFPTESQRKEIANQLLKGIESIDAITIDLRDSTRKVNWVAFKTITSNNIVNAITWNALYSSLDNIHYGILNRHSYVLIDKSISKNIKSLPRWPQFELGYSWPEVNFFSVKNSQNIDSINGRKINDIFDEFFNLYCNDIHQSGCLRLFSDYMKLGYHFLGGTSELKIKFTNGSQEKVTQQQKIKRKKRELIECESLYSSLNVSLVYNGSQSCLFESKNGYVLKIFYFGKWGSKSGDIYCEKAEDKGMCADINEVKRITKKFGRKPLTIDLQNNVGGSENTPWIAALTKKGFKDNLVLYKNIELLTDLEIRSSAFYHNDRAENWYQKVKNNISPEDKFLPLRTDFCRGSTTCEMKDINSSSQPINYSELKLIINEKCMSSCDDFIWRTRQYAQAKTYGQLSATDGAFARLNGYLYIMKNGKVKNIIVGEDYEPSVDNGTLIVNYRIPISKTVSFKGKDLEGDDTILDFPLSINHVNFTNIEEDNLRRALSL
ncbi:MAG: hypothetical protein OCD00_07425 [Colwellia sp.]